MRFFVLLCYSLLLFSCTKKTINVQEDPPESEDPANTDGVLSWQDDFAVPFSTGSVTAITRLPSGRFMIGGLFSSIKGSPMATLGMLNSDGSVNNAFSAGKGVKTISYGSEVTGQIYSIALEGDKYLAGGGFLSYDGYNISNLVRLNSNGSRDPSFYSLNWYLPESCPISAITVQKDGKILIGTSGSQFAVDDAISGPVSFSCLMRLEADGKVDFSFGPKLYMYPGDDIRGIKCITLLDDQTILVGGEFGLRKLVQNGQPDYTFAQPAKMTYTPAEAGFTSHPGEVRTIVPDGNGNLLVGGDFEYKKGEKTYRHIMRLRASGELDETFQPQTDLDNPVSGIVTLPDNRIMVGRFRNTGEAGKPPFQWLELLESNGKPVDNVNLKYPRAGVRALLKDNGSDVVIMGGIGDYEIVRCKVK